MQIANYLDQYLSLSVLVKAIFTQPTVAMIVTNIRCGQLVKQGFRMVSMREDEDSLDYDLISSIHTLLQSSGKLDLVNHK